MADWLLARCKQNMDGISYWVVNGRVDDDPYRIEGIDTPEALMERAGGVYEGDPYKLYKNAAIWPRVTVWSGP